MREPPAQMAGQVEGARRLPQKREPIAPADERERRYGRAEHAHGVVERGRGRDLASVALRFMPVAAGYDERGEPSEGRIAALHARLDLLGIEGLAVAGN